ncbi:UNVERIFIED_CONTAM: hypothetical protein Sradi_5916400, partial [Sesamum radiatum]
SFSPFAIFSYALLLNFISVARVAPESSSIIHPVDNMTSQGGHFPSQWTPAPRLSGYSPSILNGELPHYQPMAPGPSRDPFLHQPAAGNLHMLQNNYLHHPSSSNISGQTIPGVDGGFYDQAIGTGRGPYKRKSPGIPPICDRGSTSRYYDVGSSSDIHCLQTRAGEAEYRILSYALGASSKLWS